MSLLEKHDWPAAQSLVFFFIHIKHAAPHTDPDHLAVQAVRIFNNLFGNDAVSLSELARSVCQPVFSCLTISYHLTLKTLWKLITSPMQCSSRTKLSAHRRLLMTYLTWAECCRSILKEDQMKTWCKVSSVQYFVNYPSGRTCGSSWTWTELHLCCLLWH